MDPTPAIYLVTAVLGGVGVEVVRALTGRRRMNADTAKALTDAAVSLVQPLQMKADQLVVDLAAETKRCGALERAHAESLARIRRLEAKVEALTEQNRELRRRLDASTH